MSDTHSLTHKIKFNIPHGDVLIHAGDFTKSGQLQEVIDFNNWLGNIFLVDYSFLNSSNIHSNRKLKMSCN